MMGNVDSMRSMYLTKVKYRLILVIYSVLLE